jgi:tetratricopeptide (TPR) repeat protein
MGDVYRARDIRLDRTVVLKFLPPAQAEDAAARERFLREAQVASRLDHTSICTIYDIDQLDDGTQFISMAHCDGENLADRLLAGPVPAPEAARIALRVAEGLAFAHEHGVIHRDLKPANIQLTSSGEVKILDFGVARLAGQERLTIDGATVGTLPYMSPEQVQGSDTDHRTDLWALGVVLFEMLTGQRPFHGETVPALIASIAYDPVPNLATLHPDVPLDLADLVRWCLEKNPADRPTGAGDLLQSLAARARATDDTLTVTVDVPRRRRPSRGRLVGAVAVLVAALLLLVPAFWPTGPARHGVALLPWNVIGGRAPDAYLADGLVHVLTEQLELIEPRQDSAWVAPARSVRTREIVSTDRARGVLGVGDAVVGNLYVQDDLLRLELRRHETGARGSMLPNRLSQGRTIVGSRADLVAWADDVWRALVELIGWRQPTRQHVAAVMAGTHSADALGDYLKGLGAAWPFGKRGCDRERATAWIQQAAQTDPQFVPAQIARARLALSGITPDSLPDRDAALTICDAVLARVPGDFAAHYWRGVILSGGSEEPMQATSEFRRCLEIVPGHWPTQSLLIDCEMEAGRADSALATAERRRARRPDDPAIYLELGMLMWALNRLEDAQRAYVKLIELAPDDVTGYTNLGSVLALMERWEDAGAVYQRALAVDPDDVFTYQMLATTYFYRRRLLDAAHTYEAAARLDPRDHANFGWAGECYVWSGSPMARRMFQTAAALADSALDHRPHDAELAVALASYLIRLDEADRARAIVAEVAAQGDIDLNVHFTLAVCYEDLGDRQTALEQLEQAMRKGLPRDMVEKYPGLDRLQQGPGYKELLARLAAAPD